jgi:hypothetical protein
VEWQQAAASGVIFVAWPPAAVLPFWLSFRSEAEESASCICPSIRRPWEHPTIVINRSRHPERSESQRDTRSRRACPELAEGTSTLLVLLLLFAPFFLHAQTTIAASNPPSLAPAATASATPATHTFHDPTYHISFDYPANWTFAHTDGEISTFHLDARSAPRNARVRAVVAMPENPFPASTFSGAYVYFSVTPHTSAAACAQQAKNTTIVRNIPHTKPGVKTRVADVPFTCGHDEQRDICITQRDEIYTTRRAGACYRFDLASNNFCGGEVSGVKDITAAELDQVRTRQESILSTIHFDPK